MTPKNPTGAELLEAGREHVRAGLARALEADEARRAKDAVDDGLADAVGERLLASQTHPDRKDTSR